MGLSPLSAASTAPAAPTAAAAAGAGAAGAAGAATAAAAGGRRLISLGQATGSSRQAGSGPPADLQLLSHDRVKALPIPPDQPHPFLQALGLQTAQGRVKADRADKLAQVNEFLKLLEHTDRLHQLLPSSPLQPHQHPTSTPPLESPPGAGAGAGAGAAEGGGPGGAGGAAAATGSGCPAGGGVVRILDCGCGAAYLTLGTWHYLNNVLGIAARITGIDSNAALMAKSNRYCQQLGLGAHQAQFLASPIAGYAPPQPPHVILALHACDTATDEALALGVKQGALIIMAVPCCHNHLHRQLAGSKAMVAPFGPVMGHGILRQRMLDVLTDSLRALLLRIVGYKVDVVEFVSAEHTPRNVLIRAVRRGPAGYVSTTDTSSASKSAETADGDTEPTLSMMGSGSSSNDSSSSGSGTSSPGVDKLPDQASTKVTLQLVEEYKALTSFWGVRPHLETLLEAELQQLLSM
ncbi:methyltransferase domain-containing protein [Haematococcus lacustris]